MCTILFNALLAVVFRDDGCEVSCYFKVTLGNKTNGGDIWLFQIFLDQALAISTNWMLISYIDIEVPYIDIDIPIYIDIEILILKFLQLILWKCKVFPCFNIKHVFTIWYWYCKNMFFMFFLLFQHLINIFLEIVYCIH